MMTSTSLAWEGDDVRQRAGGGKVRKEGRRTYILSIIDHRGHLLSQLPKLDLAIRTHNQKSRHVPSSRSSARTSTGLGLDLCQVALDLQDTARTTSDSERPGCSKKTSDLSSSGSEGSFDEAVRH
jgi:hypothetical protein